MKALFGLSCLRNNDEPSLSALSFKQVLSLCGGGMLTFQLLVYPRLSKRIGVTKSQRWACLLAIPVYLAFPLLSRLRESGLPLVLASVLANFLSNVTATAVSYSYSYSLQQQRKTDSSNVLSCMFAV